ncbi:hypothetical protein [Leptospira bouyouniensis]|uniref:hypothetical protein n=1 Tax=Leptospira bouyouniensis TaxID=2484911 RepID=UPI001FC8FC1B|nr:hypothetical protein [Leptospira bouyouniensis]
MLPSTPVTIYLKGAVKGLEVMPLICSIPFTVTKTPLVLKLAIYEDIETIDSDVMTILFSVMIQLTPRLGIEYSRISFLTDGT